MRIGVLALPTDPWPDTVELTRRLERLGYHHLWVYDHLLWQRYRDRPWHGTMPWLAGLAASTSTIRLGTMVSNLNLRHPLVLAKDAMTIDHISAGRFTLGLGTGGTGFDATILGQPELTASARVERLAEAAELLDALLRGEATDHEGPFYRVVNARVVPGCVQRPRVPLAIAAGGARSMRLAARHGEAWITYGADIAVVAEQCRRLDECCAEVGRDPRSLERIYLAGNAGDRPLAGIAAFEDLLGCLGELGFTDVVVHMPRADDPAWDDPPEILEEIAERFLPERATIDR